MAEENKKNKNEDEEILTTETVVGIEEEIEDVEVYEEDDIAEVADEDIVEEDEDDLDTTHFMAGIDDDDDDDDWWKTDGTYSAAERRKLEDIYSSTLREFNENEIVNATVVSVGDKEVLLNIGFKSEGIVSISEFRGRTEVKPGDVVEVFIEKVEDQGGQLLLSRRRAKNLRTWERINDSMENDTILNGHVMRRTKGGFVVDIEGIEAFLPGSQIDVKPVRDFDAYVGRTMEFKVVKINEAYENVVVSHKILIEAKLEEQRKEILANLEKGQVLEGSVKNMTNFGVFIDLGGVDGLLHITDISWSRINHPQEVLEYDQKVQVVVLDFDEEKKRISLGMKQLIPHPWDSLPETIQQGSRVMGRVVTVADYGVFLEVMPGVEGLVHTSEMSWSQHVKNPGENFRVGDELEAVVLNVDRDERKMSLGFKQLQEDPWARITDKYPVGSRHKGIVRNMTNYGLFVELEEGVDGLVHISDLSWTKKFNHPSEYVKVEEQLEVMVLDIDKDNRRLSLGHKQLTEDVWQTFEAIFLIGSVHKGTIKRIDAKGAIVELDYGIEGLVTPKHLATEEGKDELKVDDVTEFAVLEFNKDAKRMLLSHTRAWKQEQQEQVQTTVNTTTGTTTAAKATPAKPAKQTTTTLGDLDALVRLKEQMEAQERKQQRTKGKGKPQSEDDETSDDSEA
ncbi:MAG: 30S ribosomal protein S1 [Bacteroidia bacterium]